MGRARSLALSGPSFIRRPRSVAKPAHRESVHTNSTFERASLLLLDRVRSLVQRSRPTPRWRTELPMPHTPTARRLPARSIPLIAAALILLGLVGTPAAAKC